MESCFRARRKKLTLFRETAIAQNADFVNPQISKMHQWVNWWLGRLYPEVCQVCDKEKASFYESYRCGSCRSGVEFIELPFCKRCGTPFEGEITNEFTCSNCLDQELHFRSARAAVRLTRVVQDVVHAYKYEGGLWFEPLLAGWLADHAAEVLPPREWDWIVPVPLHWWKARQRSFNQAERLGSILSKATGISMNTKLVRRNRATDTQTRLNRQERAENMKRAFEYRAKERIEGKRIILVDDVLTTGATASACAKVLMRNGAAVVDVWTVARGTLK